jgi:signal transduction histidine kinase
MLPYSGGFVFFAAVSMMATRQREERERAEGLLAELEEAHHRLREYAQRVEELAVAEERNRLAREIHDSLGHHLTVASVQLEAARGLLTIDPTRAHTQIDKAQRSVKEALAEVRRSVRALRPGELERESLIQSLRALIEEFEATTALLVEFKVEGEEQRLSSVTELTLYRAAQEALTNVQKHAHASQVDLTLRFAPHEVTLTVADNGVGASDLGEGFGLMGQRERAELLGGSLLVGNRAGGGFELRVSLPCRE